MKVHYDTSNSGIKRGKTKYTNNAELPLRRTIKEKTLFAFAYWLVCCDEAHEQKTINQTWDAVSSYY